jgi:hypothetical protein
MKRLRIYALTAAGVLAWLLGGALLDGPSETDSYQASALDHRDALRTARHAADPRIAAATGDQP